MKTLQVSSYKPGDQSHVSYTLVFTIPRRHINDKNSVY